MSGKVYLIGAGPGDAGLITVKGLNCLKQADVVIYDRLVNPRLLSYVKEGVELIYVGKAPGAHHIDQERINRLLVEKSLEGKMVVRLKGGDPFVFGRGGEEALELVKVGIPFEVIPGVTSAYAVPAYAGIPVTQRGYTSTLTVLTGHGTTNTLDAEIDWKKIASIGTLVFLMGLNNLSFITKRLMENGSSPDTPIAIIRWGTRGSQETLVGTLKDIIPKVKEKKFKPPAVIVVGEVVSLRDKLNWFENKPLFNKIIVTTRPQAQTFNLTERLEELGAEVVEFPVIKVIPPESFAQVDKSIENLSSYNWLIFTSVNGVQYFFQRMRDLKRDLRELKGIKLAAIGPATAKALENLGFSIDYLPEEYKAEALAEGFKREDIRGKRILLPRAKEAREVLPEELKEMGAQIDVVSVYQTVADEGKVEMAVKRLKGKKVDFITFTSSSTVKNFVKLVKERANLRKVFKGAKIACIGPITAKTAKDLGFKVEIVAKEYTVDGLVKAILDSEQ